MKIRVTNTAHIQKKEITTKGIITISFFEYERQVVFRTDRSEPNWDECVTKVENRFSKISEIGSLDREIIFRIFGSGRVGPPKIVIRSDPFGTLLICITKFSQINAKFVAFASRKINA